MVVGDIKVLETERQTGVQLDVETLKRQIYRAKREGGFSLLEAKEGG